MSANRHLLSQMAKKGNKRAQAALSLSDDPGRFISTVQIGITLVGILAGAYGGATIAEALKASLNNIAFIAPHGDTLAVVLVVSVITYCSVVIGELVPKKIALSRPEPIALFIAIPMLMISKLFTPIVMALELSASGILKILGILHLGPAKVTEVEVKAVLAAGADSGAIEHEEHHMLQRIIRFGDRDLRSIMTPRVDVTTVDINDSIEDIQQKVQDSGHSRYPVTDGDSSNVVGVVYTKTLLEASLEDEAIDVAAHVQKAPIMTELAPCLKALEQFKSSPVDMIIVVDEYGDMQGIVTGADILEAIVGHIPSNYDEDHAPFIFQRQDGSWLVDGLTPIDEIHLTIGMDVLETGKKYDTIAGFVLHHLGKTPKVEDQFEAFGFRFEIIEMDDQRIDMILITKQ